MSHRRLLLLSNSTNYASGYLDHGMAAIRTFLGPIRTLLFVPWALNDLEGYTLRARNRFAREGIEVRGLELDAHKAARAIAEAEAVFIGGGNTWRLLDRLQRLRLIEPIRQRAFGDMPYLGASAGTNITAPTIKTTNDMPVIQPASFDALGLVPFQFNPHYLDADPDSRHMGETREQRILEYLEENDLPVVGLREGGWVRVEGESVRLEGSSARLFQRGRDPEDVAAPAELTPLLAG